MLHILMLCIYLWLLLISSVVHTYIIYQKFIKMTWILRNCGSVDYLAPSLDPALHAFPIPLLPNCKTIWEINCLSINCKFYYCGYNRDISMIYYCQSELIFIYGIRYVDRSQFYMRTRIKIVYLTWDMYEKYNNSIIVILLSM